MRSTLAEVTLDDKYAQRSGTVHLSGVQALVRLTIEQRRRDAALGHDTGVFVSGYQGSPLGGVDKEMARAREHLDGVVFQPGLNEELAATAVGGTQLLGELPGARHEGVTGFWYGKSPGLDRAADAIRHATLAGTAPLGGAVAWIGDDPSAKSSTVPSSCEPMCRSLLMPLLAPGTVREVIELGLHAVALSRHAGLWTGMKIVADLADASATVDVGDLGADVPELPTRPAGHPPVLLPPTNLDAEEDLMGARLARAVEYGRAAGLNRVVRDDPGARLAVVAAGVGHQAVLRALSDLGGPRGVRVVQLRMPWPLDPGEVRELLGGVETVLVVEDKLPFLEGSVKEALYRAPDAPLVVGKRDAEGRPLLPARSALTSDDVARALGAVLGDEQLSPVARARLALLDQRPAGGDVLPMPARMPTFCSGCPHTTSTRSAPDQLVGVGIGCHTLVATDAGGQRGHLLGMPQMGGEGAQWIGLAPFAAERHFVQNLGDGTFHHSGSLAIRAAVAAGVDATYRLLYNDVVAMTGGQQAEGKLSVAEITRLLEVEGVARTIVTTPEPQGYRGARLAGNAEVRHRDALQDAMDELSEVGGVTVLIHDDRCATEERRLRRRGKLARPARRVSIDERVCEGCGDCGEKSSCMSVVPVATEFGRKTQIHLSSCNDDLSCLKGDCPSFVMVAPTTDEARIPPPPRTVDPPTPRGEQAVIRMAGVGGTGVVTVSQILQMAAHLDGLHTAGLEQTGLAQKGGPVLSDLRISPEPIDGSLRAGARSVDVLLGFDVLGAASAPTLTVLDPGRTVAVLNTHVAPTAAMVVDARVGVISGRPAVRRIAAQTRADDLLALDAEALSQRLFGDHMPANMLLAGAAFQHGCLPLSADAIERAIRLNGAGVDTNLAAFAWGRAAAADPAAVEAALAPSPPPAPQLDGAAAALIAGTQGELRRLLEIRVAELVAFQGLAYARRYVESVRRVADAEAARTGQSAVAEAYAVGLHKLMAYKDEYEVARLHLLSLGRGDVVMLHPPLLRALGMQRKIGFGRTARPMLRTLAAARGLRGTAFDPFGRTGVRRVERALVGEYEQLVARALGRLEPSSAAAVVEIAKLPDVVRGYEDVKLRSVAEFRRRAGQLLAGLQPAAPLTVTHHRSAA